MSRHHEASRYHEALGDLVESARRFAAAIRNAAHAAGSVADSPAIDAAAQLAIAECRATLLETLNDVPAMRIICTVTPLTR